MDKEMYEQFEAQRRMQNENIEAQGEEQMKMYAPTMNEQMSQAQSAVLEQVNPKKVVRTILLELKGMEEVDGELIKIRPPLVNENGLKAISLKLSIINQNITMTRLSEPKIQQIMLKLSSDLALDIGLNWVQYGIKNLNECDSIMNLILINILAALNRAEDQNEKNWSGRIAFETIGGGNRRGERPKKDTGFLSKFKLG